MEPEPLWYIAYGSNISRARLQRYLDRVPSAEAPLDTQPATLPHWLFFAHESRLWSGGSAFLDPAVDHGVGTLARAWLLTATQFASVLAQENAGPGTDVDLAGIDPGIWALAPGERMRHGPGRYGLVLGCASPDGRRALTFTTPAEPLPTPNPPSERYVDTIVEGLIDSHGLDRDAALAYLDRQISRPDR